MIAKPKAYLTCFRPFQNKNVVWLLGPALRCDEGTLQSFLEKSGLMGSIAK